MNVLSLFDGMSCGQIALNRAGIKYDNYFASEIDKYAIKVTISNYHNTVQLGSVTEVRAENLPKIDLLIGGSPCQGFSFAGKGLNFEDPRSKLFFEYVRLLKECNPRYFLLENVKMKKEYQDIISQHLGVEAIEIDSALESAQSRKRLYWTNIPGVTQPKDKEIFLKDILEDGIVDREKSHCLDANYFKGGNLTSYFDKNRRQLVFKENQKNMIQRKKLGLVVGRPNCIGHADIKGKDILKRVYSPEGKSPTITAICGGHQEKKVATSKTTWRKLTPIECERLQTVPDNYTNHVSNTQRYKMLGNGWTVDVIAHIFKGINEETIRGLSQN
jgi:DNA-cytosine methyltransferase